MNSGTVQENAFRARFPRGLEQPEGSFRFSMDALLLAAFAIRKTETSAQPVPDPFRVVSEHPIRTFVDMGTGCGVVAFALLLLTQGSKNESFWRGIGLDMDADLVASAQNNTVQLDFEDRFTALQTDIADVENLRALRRQYGAAELVLANPPWHLEGSGRTPVALSRRRALFGDNDTLHRFARAASVLGAEKSRFSCVLGANRLPDMFRALDQAGLHPSRLCFVHKQSSSPARLCLLESRRTACLLRVEPPLVLYDADHRFTQESLAFCPFL